MNGIDIERIQDYTNKVGYVSKCNVPYWGDLTVRQYLLLVAHFRQDKKVSKDETLQRVEDIISQVMKLSRVLSFCG